MVFIESLIFCTKKPDGESRKLINVFRLENMG